MPVNFGRFSWWVVLTLLVASMAVQQLAFGQLSPIDFYRRYARPQTEREATQAPDREIRFRLVKPTLQARQHAGTINHMAMSGNGKFFTVLLADNSFRLWDLESGVQRPMIKSPSGKFLAAVPASDGRTVITGADDGTIRVFDVLSGAPPRVLSAHAGMTEVLAISDDGLLLVSGATDGSVRLWDLKKFRAVRALNETHGKLLSVAISPNNNWVLTSTPDQAVRLWDVETGMLLTASATQDDKLLGAQFVKEGKEIAGLTADGTAYLWNASNGALARKITLAGQAISSFTVDQAARTAVVGSEEGALRLIDLTSSHTARKLAGHKGAVRHVFHDTERRRIISGSSDGSMHIWDSQSGDKLLDVVMTAGGWAAIDPHGRFDASEQGMGDVSWRAEDADLPLDRFSKRFFEPGLLAYYLSHDSTALRAIPGKIENGIPLPPEIEIDMPNVARDATKPFPPITVVAEDRGGGIDVIRLYHNGKLVDRGAFLQQQEVKEKGGDKRLRVTAFYVKPVPGLNTFKAVGTGLWDIEGHSEKVTATFSGPKPKSTLHIVVVGINNYFDPRLALNYSVPDAKAVIASLAQVTKGVVQQVREKRILDDQATKDNILQVLADMTREAAIDDVIIVYLAGHGLVAQGEWRFLPYESTYYPSTVQYAGKGVTASEIQDALVRAKAQRILVLIDSCQSGAASQVFQAQQRFQRQYFRNLSRISGVTVLVATRKDQQAFEMRDLGHGLFTHVLLSGLKGKADLRPADGTVTAHELVGYAAREIPDFSQRYLNYQQEPTAFALGADFPIAMAGRSAP